MTAPATPTSGGTATSGADSAGTAGSPSGRRYGLWALVVLGLLAVALVAGGPSTPGHSLDPGSTDSNGTKAMVDLLQDSGADVTVQDTSPGTSSDVAVLLSDSTSQAMTDQLERWVEAGGTLIVADPRSSFVPVATSSLDILGVTDRAVQRADCSIAALAGIEQLRPGPGVLYERADSTESCFAGTSGAFVVDTPTGRGHVVAVGSSALFTNDMLGADDNAALTVALMAPREGTTVAMLYGMVPDGGTRASGFAALIPTGVRLALLQLAIAFVLYTWWRGRRLGRPVREPQLVQIGGSELVGAVGNLMQQTHDPDRAARLLRADLRRRLAERLGLPPDSNPDVIAEVTAARSGADRDQVARAVTDHHIRTEDELLDLARDIDRIRTEVLHGTAP